MNTIWYEPATPWSGQDPRNGVSISRPSLDNLKLRSSASSCSSTAYDSSTISQTTATDNSSLTSRTSLKGTMLGNHVDGAGSRGPMVLVDASDLELDDAGEDEDNEGGEIDGHEDGHDAEDVYNDLSTTRSLNFQWEDAMAIAQMGCSSHLEGTFKLPEGISKTDVFVTIDIDDEVRFNGIKNSDACGKKKEYFAYNNDGCNSSLHSGRSPNHKLSDSGNQIHPRRRFEEAVRQGILDDLRSIYTATSATAKIVLCIVICVLDDGTTKTTVRPGGGRTGLAEIALNWRLFGADDLKIYEGGLTIERKDFGSGPLELMETEGQYYLVTKLAPRIAAVIVRKIGAVSEELMPEV